MSLDDLKKVWDDWAQEDPLYAILSDPSKTHGRWDPDEFFKTGREEIDGLMGSISNRHIEIQRRRALDFGCGVGRLSQGLAAYFERCDGVDISETMIKNARLWNKYPDRCFYHVNDQPNLSLFPDRSFDLIYSNIVLQHIEPDVSEKYIEEFVRLLSEGGLAVFQLPTEFVLPSYEPLPIGAHVATIRQHGNIPALVSGERAALQMAVRNESAEPWPAASWVHIGNHWKSGDGASVIAFDDGRGRLPHDVQPGQEAVIDLIVTSPRPPGTYVLEIDMVEELVCWFADRGSTPLSTAVSVTSRVSAAASDGDEPPPPYGMHGLAQDRVFAAVERLGGHVLAAETNSAAGPGWESYRYFVTKGQMLITG